MWQGPGLAFIFPVPALPTAAWLACSEMHQHRTPPFAVLLLMARLLLLAVLHFQKEFHAYITNGASRGSAAIP